MLLALLLQHGDIPINWVKKSFLGCHNIVGFLLRCQSAMASGLASLFVTCTGEVCSVAGWIWALFSDSSKVLSGFGFLFSYPVQLHLCLGEL